MRASLLAGACAAAAALVFACEPLPPREPRCPKCPPPPEPALQSVVVGTIGKLHLAESRYPLSRLGDVLAAFSPDLVLVGARAEPYREGKLEDASFEMTYVRYLAEQRGIPTEPIDWFRLEDEGAERPPIEPWDAATIARREAEVLSAPRFYSFEQANSPGLLARTFLAWKSEARHRGGDPLSSRRHAFLQTLTVDAVTRHRKPKRVLAYVDVLDRGHVDAALGIVGYVAKSPVEIVDKAKEEIVSDVPAEVIASYDAQLSRAKARAAKAEGADRGFWSDRARTLAVAVEKKGACCVAPSSLAPPAEEPQKP
jgi:hypothetical protein